MINDIRKRVSALIYLRALLVTLLLGSLYLLRVEYDSLVGPTVLSFFIAALYFVTIIYAIVLRYIKTNLQFRVFAYTQILLDVIAETFLIYLTGGIGSMFSFLFPLSIVSAGIVLDRKACYVISTFSSLCYALILNLQLYGVVTVSETVVFTGKEFFYNMFANITAFYLIAFLSGYLSESLQRATESLEEREVVLSDLKAFSRYIIDSMPSGVFTTDMSGRIITFNRSAEAITGHDHDYVVGKSQENIFPFLKGHQRPMERIDGEMSVGGRITPVGMRLSTLKDGTEKPIGMIGVFQDLTELKAMEAEVKRKEKWAYIGELSASIAHELRNPLASLRASVEMLNGKDISVEHADRLMKIALSEMDRLNGIITDFLLYARPQELNRESFDLHSSLREVITLLQNTVEEREGVQIRSTLDSPQTIKGDEKQLRQVFWNLGLNAIDAVSDAGSVDISTREQNNTVEICFRDTGEGISKEDMDKVFYPFFTTKEKGTGLGLSIALKIIEEHRGRIEVESEGENTGTAFRVMLPAG